MSAPTPATRAWCRWKSPWTRTSTSGACCAQDRDDAEGPPDPGNRAVNFRGERRSNATHRSGSDPDCRYVSKGTSGTGAYPGYTFTAEEKDRYCAEASAIEEPLGIPHERLPRSVSELGRYMDAMFSSGDITVTDNARMLARTIVYPPAPRMAAPALWLMRLATVGLLPPTIREGYGFSWSSRKQAMLRLSAGLIRNLLRLTPSIVRRWSAARRADPREMAPGHSPSRPGDLDSQTGQPPSTGG